MSSLLLLLAALPALAQQPYWPEDDAWIAVAGPLGTPVVDPAGDSQGGGHDCFDSLGVDPDAAGYWAADATTAWFRIRLAQSPRDDTHVSWVSFAFYTLFEADHATDDGSYDLVVALDGNQDHVHIATNSVKRGDWCSDGPDADLYQYAAPPDFSGAARVTPAGTDFSIGPGGDVFLDVQVPMADLAPLIGTTDLSTVHLVLGTGSTANHLNKDVAGATCAMTWCEAGGCDSDQDGDGLTDFDEIDDTGTDPFDADTDDDGLGDGQEHYGTGPLAPWGHTDPLDPDTDGDGLQDGTEVGVTVAGATGDTDLLVFLPDADPLTVTDPLDDDSDDDGLMDGTEDANHDGAWTAIIGGTGTFGSGETDPLDADTDGDLLQDGTESGLAAPEGVGTGAGFVPDTDPLTTTDPLDTDTDDGSVCDGVEDLDLDGSFDEGEIDPNYAPDDLTVIDSDGDGLTDCQELNLTGTDRFDADTDDDGLSDYDEWFGTGPLAPYGPTDPLVGDTDGDGLQDGTEIGRTEPAKDTDEAVFVPDADPATTTDPLDDDSDDDGLLDGTEDADCDGAAKADLGGTGTTGSGETNPNLADTDGDGIQDGTESGLTEPEGLGTGEGFVPDADPAATTNPLDTDTDDGGVADGAEDVDFDGAIDPGEIDPNYGIDDLTRLDHDGDGLTDYDEIFVVGTDPFDADTDDDGLSDYDEHHGTGPLDGIGATNPLEGDTDHDAVQDGTEIGRTEPTKDTDVAVFVPDADPATTTDPFDDDTDDDGLLDGVEDEDHDGAWEAMLGGTGTTGTGETNPNWRDTEGDGIQDGTECGLTAPQGSGTGKGFRPDDDPTTTTDPLDADTDDGGVDDGLEDEDFDGRFDDGELDPNFGRDDARYTDCDLDGLPNIIELMIGTDPCDADTDDDGLDDKEEIDGTGPLADWDPTDPLDPDTDDDGMQDGTEVGVTEPGRDTDEAVFVPDDDPSTETDPNVADTDGDGMSDGEEDHDADGRVDESETDPLVPDTDHDGFGDRLEHEVNMNPTVADVGQGGASGGCNTGGFAAGPWALLLATFVPLARRRGAFALALAAALPAAAKEPQLDIQRFDPSAQVATFTRVRDAEQATAGSVGAWVAANYGWRPFEIGLFETGERDIGVVDHLFGLDLGVEVAPTDWLSIGATMPVLQVSGLSEEGELLAPALGGSGNTVGIGDLDLQVGLAPLRQRAGHPFNLSVVPRVVIPTGTRGQFLGTGTTLGGVDLAIGRRWDPIRFTTVIGYQFAPESTATVGMYPDDELRYGVGVGIPLGERPAEIQIEWNGATIVAPEGKDVLGDTWLRSVHTPMELGVAGLWTPMPVWLKVGGSAGLVRGYGTPELRAFVQGGFLLEREPGAARDRDYDGIANADDGCDHDPEDVDGWQDFDGCPEMDNDIDFVADVYDGPKITEGPYAGFGACMNDPEDIDGWQDGDGCPDPDNDADGILDVLDGHRLADGTLATLAGFGATGDCANEAEVFNGYADEDGCADIAPARVDWGRSEIVVLDEIFFAFDSAEIDPRSDRILEAIRSVLAEHPDIVQVEIQGHTDERGAEDYNLSLSQARVESVLTWLVEHGIEADRLVAKGYGESMPRVPGADTEEEHAQNRRVQFMIVKHSRQGADE